MQKVEVAPIEEAIESLGDKVTALEVSLCEQKAYLHAIEALVIQLITDHGIDEEAIKAALGALLHDAPKTDAVARKRASYLINFRRLAKSPSLYHQRAEQLKKRT